MTMYNFWIGMSSDLQSELVQFLYSDTTPVNFPLLANMCDETKEFFRQSHDSGTLDKLFRHYDAQGRNYRVWSFYVIRPEDTTPVRNDLDAIAATYPLDFLIMGAWDFDTGVAVQAYPSPASLINFMPLVWEYVDPPGEWQSTEPTELVNVNLLLKQAPREFI